MSTNKSKIPLDKEFAPKPSMVVKTIDMNDKEKSTPVVSAGVRLVEADNTELQINEEELKMATDSLTDITDFGEFAPTQVVNIEDATEFPTLDGTIGIIQDSEEPKSK